MLMRIKRLTILSWGTPHDMSCDLDIVADCSERTDDHQRLITVDVNFEDIVYFLVTERSTLGHSLRQEVGTHPANEHQIIVVADRVEMILVYVYLVNLCIEVPDVVYCGCSSLVCQKHLYHGCLLSRPVYSLRHQDVDHVVEP